VEKAITARKAAEKTHKRRMVEPRGKEKRIGPCRPSFYAVRTCEFKWRLAAVMTARKRDSFR
jgi:hypothetical protein